MPTLAPSSAEAFTKGTILVSVRLATTDLWGEAAWRDVIRQLPADAAQAMSGGELTALGWYPTRFVQDCERAVLAGPAGGSEAEFRRFIRRSIDMGFGRVRRALLRLATPELLAGRAAELWRHDHSVGELSIDRKGKGLARLVLRGHPFVDAPLSRIAVAEVLRHVVSLSGVPDVRETHAREGEGLSVSLTWDAR